MKTSWFVIGLGWLIFAASFFLPATNVVARGGTSPGTPLLGWDAAMSSLMLLATFPIVIFAVPKSLLLLACPMINVLMLFAPVLAAYLQDDSYWVAAILVPAGLLPLMLPTALRGEVFIGFYLWIASFFVVSAGCFALSWTYRRCPMKI